MASDHSPSCTWAAIVFTPAAVIPVVVEIVGAKLVFASKV
jgi:hypothetical protein